MILAEHMEKMVAGDHYDVISDLTSWRDHQLDGFQEQTGLAIEKGTRVRRVFNLLKPPGKLKIDDRIEILKRHFEDAEIWNEQHKDGYQVRMFTHVDLRKLEKMKPRLIEAKKSEIEKAHFGIFSHVNQGQTTLVECEVRSDDLSGMTLWKNPGFISDQLDLFEIIWNATEERTKDTIPYIPE